MSKTKIIDGGEFENYDTLEEMVREVPSSWFKRHIYVRCLFKPRSST